MTSKKIALIAAFPLLLAGCSGPTDPIADPISLQGEVAFQGSESHTLPLDDAGIITIDVRTLRSNVVDPTTLFDLSPFLGLAIGRPDGEQCSSTSQVTVREGDHLVYGLNDAEYCIRLFDTGVMPEDTVVEYTLEAASE